MVSPKHHAITLTMNSRGQQIYFYLHSLMTHWKNIRATTPCIVMKNYSTFQYTKSCKFLSKPYKKVKVMSLVHDWSTPRYLVRRFHYLQTDQNFLEVKHAHRKMQSSKVMLQQHDLYCIYMASRGIYLTGCARKWTILYMTSNELVTNKFLMDLCSS